MALVPHAHHRAWPLVGRSAESSFALETIEQGQSVVVAGAAGVGKTHLLNALRTTLAEQGWTVEHTVGTHAGRTIPLAAMASLLPPGALGGSRDQVLATIVRAVDERRSTGRVAVCIDDAHLLDDSSATLVGLLARLDGVVLLVGVRSGETVPDPVAALWKDAGTPRLELWPLSEVETAQLLGAVLDGRVEPPTVRMLWQITQGNGLYLRELVAGGLGDGSLHAADGIWTWTGPPTMSPSLRDLVRSRLGDLDADHTLALEAIAISEPIAPQVIEAVVGATTLDALERDGVIQIDRVGQRQVARVGHPLYGEIVRSETPSRAADRIRLQVADAIEAAGMRRADDVLRVAVLRIDAGAPPDQEALVTAARQAWAMTDTTLVERLVAAALALGPHAEATYLAAEALADRARYQEAVDTWSTLLAEDHDDVLLARVAVAAATVLVQTLDRATDASTVLADTEARVVDADARNRIAAAGAALFAHRQDDAVLRSVTNDLLAADEASDEMLVWAWIASARVRMMNGEYDSVVAEVAAASAAAERARRNWPLSMAFVTICEFYALLLAGELDEAETLARVTLDTTISDPHPQSRAFWSEALGDVLLARGNLTDALTHLEDSVSLLRPNDNGTLRLALGDLALARALHGDPLGARAALDELAGANRGMIEPILHPARARAAILAAEGDVRGARDAVAAHVAWARTEGAMLEVQALHDLARNGRAADAASRLQELAATVDGALVAAHAGHAAAASAQDAVGLLAAADRYETIGCLLDAAESASAAATLLRSAGRTVDAAAAERRADQLAQRCPGARTPALERRDHPTPLTRREREVALLVARGLPDAAVAEQLFISIRTVNAHLRSVYAKLGVAGRQDLAAALGTDDLTLDLRSKRR